VKTIKAYEFGDLSPELQEKVKARFIDEQVQFEMEGIIANGDEDDPDFDFEAIYGCSQHYAETTGWFVPSCYYEKHKEDIDLTVETKLKNSLFSRWGQVID